MFIKFKNKYKSYILKIKVDIKKEIKYPPGGIDNIYILNHVNILV